MKMNINKFQYTHIIIITFMSIRMCSQKISLVEPIEYCLEKSECQELGFKANIDCVDNICTCVNNTKYKKNIKGCFKNVGFGESCTNNFECTIPGTICQNENCTEGSCKICNCPFGSEFVAGKCQSIKDKYLRTCYSNKDCNPGNMICNSNKCACPLKHIFYKNECVPEVEINICQTDYECSHIFNSVCIKMKNNSIGSCQCTMNHINFENNCVEYMPCLIDKDCINDYNCHILQNSKHGICYEGLICKNNEILINNECMAVLKSICSSNEDCKNNKEICYPITTNKGVCIPDNRESGVIRTQIPCVQPFKENEFHSRTEIHQPIMNFSSTNIIFSGANCLNSINNIFLYLIPCFIWHFFTW